jgi:LytS/YehU family sensor histidine kinase
VVRERAAGWWLRASAIAQALLFGTVVTLPLYFLRREQDATLALRAAKLQQLTAQRQEIEGRLRSLQAQIEPHFLFNTLAHIRRLHEVDAARGRAMLRSLIDYLGSALPQMRDPESTLGRELALTRAYLNVQQIRMGERLRVDIDVPDVLLDAAVPSMMVLTLAENAIKHGLGPKRDGGLRASIVGARLVVQVDDDRFVGNERSGETAAHAVLRQRIGTLYGPGAQLTVAVRQPRCARATIVIDDPGAVT